MATFGPYAYRTLVPGAFPITPPLLGGFGLLAEGGVDKNGGIEIGMFYLNQVTYYRKEGAFILAERVKRMHISMGYRHWFNERLSAGLGFFSSYAMGDPKVIQRDPLPSGEVSTSAQDTTEYGLDLSLQWEFVRFSKSAILLDLRYSHSLTPKAGEHGHTYGALLGYKIPISFQ